MRAAFILLFSLFTFTVLAQKSVGHAETGISPKLNRVHPAWHGGALPSDLISTGSGYSKISENTFLGLSVSLEYNRLRGAGGLTAGVRGAYEVVSELKRSRESELTVYVQYGYSLRNENVGVMISGGLAFVTGIRRGELIYTNYGGGWDCFFCASEFYEDISLTGIGFPIELDFDFNTYFFGTWRLNANLLFAAKTTSYGFEFGRVWDLAY